MSSNNELVIQKKITKFLNNRIKILKKKLKNKTKLFIDSDEKKVYKIGQNEYSDWDYNFILKNKIYKLLQKCADRGFIYYNKVYFYQNPLKCQQMLYILISDNFRLHYTFINILKVIEKTNLTKGKCRGNGCNKNTKMGNKYCCEIFCPNDTSEWNNWSGSWVLDV